MNYSSKTHTSTVSELKDNNMMINDSPNPNNYFTKELLLDNETYILKVSKINPSRIFIKCQHKYDYLSLHFYTINLSYEEFCKLAKTFRIFDNIDEIFYTIKNLVKGINYSFNNGFANYMGNQPNLGIQIPIQNQMIGQQGMQGMNPMMGQQQQMGNPMGGMGQMPGQMQGNNPMGQQGMGNNPMGNTYLNNNGFNGNVERNVRIERSQSGSINLILKIPLLNEKYERVKIEFKKENKDVRQQYEKIKQKFIKIKKIAFSNPMNNINQNNSMNLNPNSMVNNGMNQQMQQQIMQNNQNNPMTNVNQGAPTPSPSDIILSQIINEFLI